MKRREFLRLATIAPLAFKAPLALAKSESKEQGWRTFEMVYDVDLSAHMGAGRVWLPLPQELGNYQRLMALSWSDSAPGAGLYRDSTYGANMFSVAWGKDELVPSFTVTAKVATRDRTMEPAAGCSHSNSEAQLYLQPTKHIPVDGIVAKTSQSIVKSTMTQDEKAHAIYEWVVDNTFRDPKVRGCGMGNIKFMLESGNLGGKCADISSLFVGLARAAGIPAREIYGVRVAQSKQMKCLGSSGDISKAQHCRAEYFSPIHGWVAVDPADVRKAVLQEKLALDNPSIKKLRKYLFGSWEMNWVGFNMARDFNLGSGGGDIPYLMYPYARVADKVLDGRSPEDFKFTLTSKEVIV
jgi:transglutaminase-like putative cysteine protease